MTPPRHHPPRPVSVAHPAEPESRSCRRHRGVRLWFCLRCTSLRCSDVAIAFPIAAVGCGDNPIKKCQPLCGPDRTVTLLLRSEIVRFHRKGAECGWACGLLPHCLTIGCGHRVNSQVKLIPLRQFFRVFAPEKESAYAHDAFSRRIQRSLRCLWRAERSQPLRRRPGSLLDPTVVPRK